MAFCEVESEIDREFDLGVPSDDGCESCLWPRERACVLACLPLGVELQPLLVSPAVKLVTVCLRTASKPPSLSCFCWETADRTVACQLRQAAVTTAVAFPLEHHGVASPNANSPHSKSLPVRTPSYSCCTRTDGAQRCIRAKSRKR